MEKSNFYEPFYGTLPTIKSLFTIYTISMKTYFTPSKEVPFIIVNLQLLPDTGSATIYQLNKHND